MHSSHAAFVDTCPRSAVLAPWPMIFACNDPVAVLISVLLAIYGYGAVAKETVLSVRAFVHEHELPLWQFLAKTTRVFDKSRLCVPPAV